MHDQSVEHAKAPQVPAICTRFDGAIVYFYFSIGFSRYHVLVQSVA